MRTEFESLKGKVITKFIGLDPGSGRVTILTDCGREYRMMHHQDCCERVSIDEIHGDQEDIATWLIVDAEVVSGNYGDGMPAAKTDYGDDSYTWTFYKLSTIKGSMTIRWYGTSNGYYSEGVDFEEIKRGNNGCEKEENYN